MKRHACSILCLTVFAIVPAARGQSSELDFTDISAIGEAATDTSSQAVPDLGQTIRQELRGTLAQVLADLLHEFFSDLRASLGLPEVSTNAAIDPLTILESIIDNAITTALEPQTNNP